MDSNTFTLEEFKEIVLLISKGHREKALEQLKVLHPVDIAELISQIELEEAISVIRTISSKKTSEVILEVDDHLRNKILEILSSKEIAKEIMELDSDDAVDVIANLEAEKRETVIQSIANKEHAARIVELLRYEENTAGGLMEKEFVQINENWDITTSFAKIREQATKISKLHSVYVVDDDKKLKGRISVKDLLTASHKTIVKDFCISEIKYVSVSEKTDEIIRIMSRYDLESIPVVDELGRLVGRITIDDVIDIMKEEADKDYQLAAGITEDVAFRDSTWRLIRARLPWLIIGSMGGLGAASVIKVFDDIMYQFPVLLIFIPLIQSTAGNVGVQSSAIVVQSIANNRFSETNIFKQLLKELSVGLANGIAITTIVVAIVILVFHMPINVLITVGISLIVVIVNAGLIGTFIPYFLNKKNIDPAVATGPFITTAGDIIGILLYFFIAKMILFS